MASIDCRLLQLPSPFMATCLTPWPRSCAHRHQQPACFRASQRAQTQLRSAGQQCAGAQLCETPAQRDAFGACSAVRRQPVATQAAAEAPAAAPAGQSLAGLTLDNLLNTQVGRALSYMHRHDCTALHDHV